MYSKTCLLIPFCLHVLHKLWLARQFMLQSCDVSSQSFIGRLQWRCGLTEFCDFGLESFNLAFQWLCQPAKSQHRRCFTIFIVWRRSCCTMNTCSGALYNLGSGSRFAWGSDTTAHYAAIHCPRQQTIGPAVQHADIPPPQSATLSLHPIARKLLLISRPAKGRRLS